MTSAFYIYKPGRQFGQCPERKSQLEESISRDRKIAYVLGTVISWKSRFILFGDHLKRIKHWQSELRTLSELEYYAKKQQLLKTNRCKKQIKDKDLHQLFALISIEIESELSLCLHDQQFHAAWYLLRGNSVEMATGEGKSITASMAAIVAAIAGVPVHVITTNEYLVQRDANAMKHLFNRFGLSVGVALNGQAQDKRRAAYQCNITYVTNKQLVFDYLHDLQNSQFDNVGLCANIHSLISRTPRRNVTRGLCFAIIDELDSVLIDDAGIPLILSKPSKAPSGEAVDAKIAIGISRTLVESIDFELNHEHRSARLTESGVAALGSLSRSLDGIWKLPKYRNELIRQALVALHIYQRGKDYIVADRKLVLIDENTGRTLPDRRLQHSLHTMLEIKEKCQPTDLLETSASISFQNFFQRYHQICGLSGTLKECRKELYQVYGLKTVLTPPHKKRRHSRLATSLTRNRHEQINLLVECVDQIRGTGRPILIGTRSVEFSNRVSDVLRVCDVPHRVLNAEQTEQEAQIISEAGCYGAVTVATNMAGRGTDIMLADGIADLGGLHIINLEVNESNRVDRQLTGRASRQGDPGSSQYIYSATDDLFKHAPSFFLSLLEGLCAGRVRIFSGTFVDLTVKYLQICNTRKAERKRMELARSLDSLGRRLAISGPRE